MEGRGGEPEGGKSPWCWGLSTTVRLQTISDQVTAQEDRASRHAREPNHSTFLVELVKGKRHRSFSVFVILSVRIQRKQTSIKSALSEDPRSVPTWQGTNSPGDPMCSWLPWAPGIHVVQGQICR